MSLLGFGIVILHIFILTISYELICKVTKKERYLFIACIFVYQSVAEFFFDFISLAGLGIEKFIFPFILYTSIVVLKKYDKHKGMFISLLLSLLYHSTHTFLSVTLSSITGDAFVIEHEVMFYLGVLLLTYFIIKKIITYFHLELTYFDKDYLYPFLKKVIVAFFGLHILLF
ncbi:signal transduction histidine kinase, partial [Streptococcus sp. GMD6S]